MKSIWPALALVSALSACSMEDGESAGNASNVLKEVTGVSGAPSQISEKPDIPASAPEQKTYADLFSCRFQLRTMETGSMDVTGEFADEVAAEFKDRPDALKECLKTLKDRQAARAAPGAQAAPADTMPVKSAPAGGMSGGAARPR